MADQPSEKDDAKQTEATNNAVPASLSVLTQYIKDLSFESPGAPQSLRARDKAPSININVNVNANPLGGTDYDVLLTLSAKAEAESSVLFNVELVYGGVFPSRASRRSICFRSSSSSARACSSRSQGRSSPMPRVTAASRHS